MSLKPPTPPSTQSGQHPAVIEYREKLDSITENTIPELEKLNRRIAKITSDTKDDRREDDEEIPVDIVEFIEEKILTAPESNK